MTSIRGDYNNYLKTYRKQTVNKVDQKGKADQAQRTDQSARTEKRDALELTGISREMKVARQKIGELDAQQSERVKELKDAIAQGTYDVSGREIADKMIEQSGFDQEV